MTPDFARIASIAAPSVVKDGKHTLFIFSVLGLAFVGWGFFNEESTILFSCGAFFLTLGIARYFVERYKRPVLKVGVLKGKWAVPYTRIPGTFDFFIYAEVNAQYAFSRDGQSDTQTPVAELQLKVSAEIFSKVSEEQQIMILLSSTGTPLGVFIDDYVFLPS